MNKIMVGVCGFGAGFLIGLIFAIFNQGSLSEISAERDRLLKENTAIATELEVAKKTKLSASKKTDESVEEKSPTFDEPLVGVVGGKYSRITMAEIKKEAAEMKAAESEDVIGHTVAALSQTPEGKRALERQDIAVAEELKLPNKESLLQDKKFLQETLLYDQKFLSHCLHSMDSSDAVQISLWLDKTFGPKKEHALDLFTGIYSSSQEVPLDRRESLVEEAMMIFPQIPSDISGFGVLIGALNNVARELTPKDIIDQSLWAYRLSGEHNKELMTRCIGLAINSLVADGVKPKEAVAAIIIVLKGDRIRSDSVKAAEKRINDALNSGYGNDLIRLELGDGRVEYKKSQ
jgi:hypothetical protein